MAGDGRACDACARNCVTFHKEEKDHPPLVTRFWKDVLGKEDSNCLPPKFTRRVKLVAGQETQIEDVNGERWSLTLSYVNGSPAFQEGWNKFFVDHGVKARDMLIFNYVKWLLIFLLWFYNSVRLLRIHYVLDLMRRGEGLRLEDVMLFEHSAFAGMADIHDRHRDMRLDVDNMSYEELLALEERIGNVCTGLNEESITSRLKQRKYVEKRPKDNQTEIEPCSICREDYNDGEDLGTLECGFFDVM